MVNEYEKMYNCTYIGMTEVLVVDRETNNSGNTYIICKVLNPTFEDRPFMTIAEDVMDNGTVTRYSGHYDMNLMDACADFYKRLGYPLYVDGDE
jgi:hypothetical protein